jgi:transposase
MELTQKQFDLIQPLLPVQRGNVEIDNLVFLRAVLLVVENGCKWRTLPASYGKWNSVRQRAKRWAQNGVFARVFAFMQEKHLLRVEVRLLALDSTSVKAHSDAHGVLKKRAGSRSANPGEAGTPSFIWHPRMTRTSS